MTYMEMALALTTTLIYIYIYIYIYWIDKIKFIKRRLLHVKEHEITKKI